MSSKPIKDLTDTEAMAMVNQYIAESNKDKKLRKCRWTGCKNKVIIDILGPGYFCRYHKLLGEVFFYEKYAEMNLSKKEMQRMIEAECEELGKEECDKIVIEGAKDPINWFI